MRKFLYKITAALLLFALVTGCAAQLSAGEGASKTQASGEPSLKVDAQLFENERVVAGQAEYMVFNGALQGRGEDSLGLFPHAQNGFCAAWDTIAENVQHFDTDGSVLLYLTDDGKIYGVGQADSAVFCGQDVQPDANGVVREPVLLFEDCSYFSLGDGFVTAIKTDASLWFWGDSRHGQGTQVCDQIEEPQQIAQNVQYAENFGATSAWIDFQGSLYLCGDNSKNQIGNGTSGCGDPDKLQDIVSTPYCALRNCLSFTVTENGVLYAKTSDGETYMWGNFHSAAPTAREAELAPVIIATEFASGVSAETNGRITDPGGVMTFAKEQDANGAYSQIVKTSIYDAEKTAVITGLVPPFTMFMAGSGLMAASVNDDCLYFISYQTLTGGRINNIQRYLLHDGYAVPVTVQDSQNLVLATPCSDRALVLNTMSGDTQAGDLWADVKMDSAPVLSAGAAQSLARQELQKATYTSIGGKTYDFSDLESCTLYFQPELRGDPQSWITPDSVAQRESMTWCYCLRFSDPADDLAAMDVCVDANTGTIYQISFTSD